MGEQVDEEVKSRRLSELQALLGEQARTFNESMAGRTLPVLLEREGRHPGQLVGRSPYLQAVVVEAPKSALGKIVDVEIDRIHSNSLAGRIVGGEAFSGVPMADRDASEIGAAGA